MMHKVEIELGGRTLSLETGRLAKQAGGAVLARYGETMVLVTAVRSREQRPGIDFLPLLVDYQEMTYAAGRIPGGFFKREGRPSEKEILTSRLMDRPLRPLFPEGYRNDIQIVATVLSADQENDPDLVAMVAASAALEISDIPFRGPIAGVRVGRVGGQWVLNPTHSQLPESEVNVVVAGGRDGITMVEGGASEVPESGILDALYFGYESLMPLLDLQDRLRELAGKPKKDAPLVVKDPELEKRVRAEATEAVREATRIAEKMARHGRLDAVTRETLAKLVADFPGKDGAVRSVLGEIEAEVVRQHIRDEKKRIDGRGLKDIRPISCDVGLLPRTHGSALFTRGETQALATVTLGSSSDEQKIDALTGGAHKSFMLHYKFPPFCVGEVKPLRGPSRREIGHGALAERALRYALPPENDFPYTIRLVSEVLESNGSSSMATVCGGCLSLMDAGVPIKAPVAGIAMGLVKEGAEFLVLSDILGDEDHLGDMDFKVAGTSRGVTAIQMDIKCDGVTRDIMSQALDQAREGRRGILEKMAATLDRPRQELAPHAPRITKIHINPERIKDVIGPGGKVIRGITEKTGAKIEVEDDGTVLVFATDQAAGAEAVAMVRGAAAEAEIGKIYKGKVRRIMDFGAFVEILPGVDGLVHISQLDKQRVKEVRDVVQEGDEILVKVLDVDRQGKIRLSRKDAMDATEPD